MKFEKALEMNIENITALQEGRKRLQAGNWVKYPDIERPARVIRVSAAGVIHVVYPQLAKRNYKRDGVAFSRFLKVARMNRDIREGRTEAFTQLDLFSAVA